MRGKWKRTIYLILAGAGLLGGLTACAKETRQEEQSGGEEHEPLTIIRFNNLINEEFVDALHEVYPEINLQIVSYGGANGTGQAQFSMEQDDMTDIYVTPRAFHRELMPERFVNLADYDFINNYSTFLLNSLDVEGGIYMLPSGYTVTGISYNKTIMEDHGWEVPGSFEELEALVPAIEEAGYQPFANAIDLDGYPFNYFFNIGNTVYFGTQDGIQWKEQFIKGEAAASGDEGLEAVAQYYNEWIEHGFITNEHTAVSDYIKSENIVFYLSLGLYDYEYEAEDGKVYEFGVMPWLSRDGSGNMLTRNIPRYFAVNKHLEEPGNEQKLEDALHVMEFLSSEAGQKLIVSTAGSNPCISPLTMSEIPEDSPYNEVADLIHSGHTVQQVYVGWENLIIPLAQNMRAVITGELAAEELPRTMDETYNNVVNLGNADIHGTLTETLTYEKTAELCAIAEGKAVDADCAMVSLNEYHGDDLYNSVGVGWYLWAGKIDTHGVHLIRPSTTTLSVLSMTGAQIKELQAGGFDFDGNGRPYEYLLVTKGGMELEDDQVYRLAVGTQELAEELRGQAETVEISAQTAITEYITELGTFGADDIIWE